jgi:hypothetical protein
MANLAEGTVNRKMALSEPVSWKGHFPVHHFHQPWPGSFSSPPLMIPCDHISCVTQLISSLYHITCILISPAISNPHVSVSCKNLADKPPMGPLVRGSRRCIILKLLLPVCGVPMNHKVAHFILIFKVLAELTWLILLLCHNVEAKFIYHLRIFSWK